MALVILFWEMDDYVLSSLTGVNWVLAILFWETGWLVLSFLTRGKGAMRGGVWCVGACGERRRGGWMTVSGHS